MNKSSKFSGNKTTLKIFLCFYLLIIKKSKRINKTIYIMSTKRIKYFGIHLAKEAKIFILSTIKHCCKKLKYTQINEKIIYIHRLEDIL